MNKVNVPVFINLYLNYANPTEIRDLFCKGGLNPLQKIQIIATPKVISNLGRAPLIKCLFHVNPFSNAANNNNKKKM